MKIVKPTLESLLEETDDIYVRFENINGAKALVAGGINRNGMWAEFPIMLAESASLMDVTRSLQAMVHITIEKHKRWHIEDSYHSFIRQIGTCLN